MSIHDRIEEKARELIVPHIKGESAKAQECEVKQDRIDLLVCTGRAGWEGLGTRRPSEKAVEMAEQVTDEIDEIEYVGFQDAEKGFGYFIYQRI